MMKEYFVGVDLGQAQDFTAVCVLEQELKKVEGTNQSVNFYNCRHLERLPLGTRYPAIVEHIKTTLKTPELRNARLVVDATGVGAPVVDMMRQSGLRLTAVSITGADSVSHEGGMARVPKRILVSTLQVLMQSGRLLFAAGIPDTQKLIEEMLAFQVKISDTAHDSYGSWRSGTHDDLVLAVAMAAWKAEHSSGGTVHSF
jgi:hypothetical protein